MIDEQELLKKLQQAFKEEAAERLLSIDGQLSVLELNHSPQEFQNALEVIFRDAHSLKGAARSVGLTALEPFFQAAEDVFSGLKKCKIEFSPEIIHIIQHANSALEIYLANPDDSVCTATISDYTKKIKIYNAEHQIPDGNGEPTVATSNQLNATETDVPTATLNAFDETLDRHPATTGDEEQFNAKNIERYKQVAANFMRINKEKLDSLLQQSDELIVLKQIFPERKENILNLYHEVKTASQFCNTLINTIHVLRSTAEWQMGDTPMVNNLISLCRRLENHAENLSGRIDHMTNRLDLIVTQSADDVRTSTKLVDGFRDKLKMIALMPFSTLTGTFPRMMRDLASEVGREFEFVITGSNIEIDRRVLDELRDPIIHLLRNAADHGVEKREIRVMAGKNPCGRIELSIGIAADKKIEICVSDDGGGINLEKIRRKLIDESHLSEQTVREMADEKIINHIFDSGFTTSAIITTISGRGLGMAIVRDKIEGLGGTLRIDTQPGVGTAFIISLPAALSSQRGIIFKAGGRLLAMACNGIEALTRIKTNALQTVKGHTSLNFHGDTLPLYDMATLLELPEANATTADKLTVIILSLTGIRAGFIIEGVIREREMIVKPLGSLMPKVPNIIGMTVTGNGEIIPVLNSRDILQYAASGKAATLTRGSHEQTTKPIILLAEDSITSRTLLTSILEAAGYEVITAVDGEAAWQQLVKTQVDLVVSDIEMPRIDGFELTEKIRAHAKLSSLPIVLVTSLSKPEDRERGINLGANAYITKGDFSQTHLLDTVERLL